MSHTIKIGDESYSLLTEQAAEAGVAPDVWVERKIKEGASRKRSRVSEKRRKAAWEEFIGASARLPDPSPKRVKSVFGEALKEKFRKMGLRVDYDSD